MISTLRFEFIRLKNFLFFWVILVLYALCLTVSFKASTDFVGGALGNLGGLADSVMKTTTGLLAMASLSGFFEVFLSYVVISLLVQEKEYGTLKQHFIEGQSHFDWVVGKFLIVFLLGLLATGLLGGNAYFFLDQEVFTADLEKALNILGKVFLRVLGVLSIATVAGVLVKRTIKGIMLFTVYTLFGEVVISWLVGTVTGRDIGNWLPYGRFSGVVPKPWSGLEAMAAETLEGSSAWSSHPAILALYLLLLWVLIYFLIKFADTADSSG